MARTNSPRPQSTYSFRDVGDDPTVSRRTSAASRYSYAIPAFPSEDASIMSPIGGEDEQSSFTYIPSSTKKYYKRLVELCIDADLRAMSELDGDEDVSLGILSVPHLELIGECALRWRIGSPYRVACSLDIIKYKYEREEIPLECIPEAMTMVEDTASKLPLDDWSIEEVCR